MTKDSLYVLWPRELPVLDKGDVLLKGIWRSYYQNSIPDYYEEDYESDLFVLMRLDGKELGLVSDVNDDIAIPSMSAKLLSNPVQDKLCISFDKPFKGDAQILTATGQMLDTYTITNNQHFETSIIGLSSGIYFVHFKGDNGAVIKPALFNRAS